MYFYFCFLISTENIDLYISKLFSLIYLVPHSYLIIDIDASFWNLWVVMSYFSASPVAVPKLHISCFCSNIFFSSFHHDILNILMLLMFSITFVKVLWRQLIFSSINSVEIFSNFHNFRIMFSLLRSYLLSWYQSKHLESMISIFPRCTTLFKRRSS